MATKSPRPMVVVGGWRMVSGSDRSSQSSRRRAVRSLGPSASGAAPSHVVRQLMRAPSAVVYHHAGSGRSIPATPCSRNGTTCDTASAGSGHLVKGNGANSHRSSAGPSRAPRGPSKFARARSIIDSCAFATGNRSRATPRCHRAPRSTRASPVGVVRVLRPPADVSPEIQPAFHHVKRQIVTIFCWMSEGYASPLTRRRDQPSGCHRETPAAGVVRRPCGSALCRARRVSIARCTRFASGGWRGRALAAADERQRRENGCRGRRRGSARANTSHGHSWMPGEEGQFRLDGRNGAVEHRAVCGSVSRPRSWRRRVNESISDCRRLAAVLRRRAPVALRVRSRSVC